MRLFDQLERLIRDLQDMVATAFRRIEGLEAKLEQMQSVVQPQDAALDSDESGVQPAGNPDGDSLEAAYAWAESQIVEWTDHAWDVNYAKGRRDSATEFIKRFPFRK